MWPEILGQRSVRWPDVFDLIRQPALLWAVYKPGVAIKDLDVKSVWEIWSYGERIRDSHGSVIAQKPPLRELERRFGYKWRSQIDKVRSPYRLSTDCKAKHLQDKKLWERFREVPEWIERLMGERGLTSPVALFEVESMRVGLEEDKMIGMYDLISDIKKLRKELAMKPKVCI